MEKSTLGKPAGTEKPATTPKTPATAQDCGMEEAFGEGLLDGPQPYRTGDRPPEMVRTDITREDGPRRKSPAPRP